MTTRERATRVSGWPVSWADAGARQEPGGPAAVVTAGTGRRASAAGHYPDAMRYQEVEKAIRQLIDAAGEDELHAFGLATITRLITADLVDEADEEDLDEDARAALATALETVTTAGAAELRALLDRIDEGTLADGDMDPGLLIVLTALEHWTTYLEEHRRGELYELAIRSLEEVDYRVSAELDDFLAEPQMAAEYARIRQSLTA
ncbi:hypothetical protein ACQP0I_01860 [Micromonospora carbonacea]|uniref:hypothetical protein n=1 Tax=Micromonospora carbonacea TaxID=47853 RepID=UPI003D96ACC9